MMRVKSVIQNYDDFLFAHMTAIRPGRQRSEARESSRASMHCPSERHNRNVAPTKKISDKSYSGIDHDSTRELLGPRAISFWAWLQVVSLAVEYVDVSRASRSVPKLRQFLLGVRRRMRARLAIGRILFACAF